jgi:transposase InsO family protein
MRSSDIVGCEQERRAGSQGFSAVKGSIFHIKMFQTDRGSEFDNTLIDELLDSYQISHSLSMKEYPYDNAVAERRSR